MITTDNTPPSTDEMALPAISREKNAVRWYVCRYRVLSNDIRALETFEEEGIQVFFPFAERKQVSKGKTVLHRKPLLPGFIFVKASLTTLQEHDRFKLFTKMKSLDRETRYLTIRDDDMEKFMWAARGFQELDLFSFDDESQAKYDIVEFGDDEEHKIYAYLETVQGKKGGNFIIPLGQEDLAQAIEDQNKLANYRLLKGTLCYKETAVNRQFRVRRISLNNKYHSKFVGGADKVSREALDNYIAGKPIHDKVRRKLQMNLDRYKLAKALSFKFQAKINAMLFRCAKVLERTDEAKAIEKTIRKEIIPAYKQYIRSLSKYNQPKAQAALQHYAKDIEKTKHS